MLDFSIQLAAACGPIALAIMGVVVSLNPPTRKVHRVWASAFVIVGLLAAGAIFFELRGTDQILGQIWERIKEPQPQQVAAKTGARMFFHVDGFTKDSKKIQVTMTNNGDVMARTASLVGSYYFVSDHLLNEKEEDAGYAVAVKSLPTMGVGVEVPINMSRITEIEINVPEAQYNSIINGTLHFYLFVATHFKDEITPPGHVNSASVCAHFSKTTTNGLACLSHTESRVQN